MAGRQRNSGSKVNYFLFRSYFYFVYSLSCRKAMELHRLLELKSSMTNINANNQCIFCVDIAANIMGSNFDSVIFPYTNYSYHCGEITHIAILRPVRCSCSIEFDQK